MNKQSPRRSFSTSIAAAAFGGVAMAQVKQPAATRWEPTRHDKDDWLDQIPGKHRMVFDSITPDTLGDSILFAGNFIKVNKSDYGLESNELALVVVMRHLSTPFGFNDAMWAKYGTAMAKLAGFEDPKTKEIWRLVPPDFPFKGLWERINVNRTDL